MSSHLSPLEWFDLIGVIVAVLAPPAIAWIDWLGRSRAAAVAAHAVARSVPVAALWSTLSVLVGVVLVLTNFQLFTAPLFAALKLWPTYFAFVVAFFLIYDSVRIVRGLRRLAHHPQRP